MGKVEEQIQPSYAMKNPFGDPLNWLYLEPSLLGGLQLRISAGQ